MANNENKRNIQKICNLLFGSLDLFAFILVVLPLYPNTTGVQIYSVRLSAFTEVSRLSITLYWIIFLGLITLGFLKIALTQLDTNKGQKILTWCSIGISIFGVLLLCITRRVYATILMFALLVIKGVLFLKYTTT